MLSINNVIEWVSNNPKIMLCLGCAFDVIRRVICNLIGDKITNKLKTAKNHSKANKSGF